ncbi:unnamed protein product [Tuber aestivum]|uniref:Uncharacterized protein n=1 Tax=Tuber aestivum TaxID=59557 RepID=A0A292Q3X3_9PEZI|nr:unnamed protein product [Tuber aestivum]
MLFPFCLFSEKPWNWGMKYSREACSFTARNHASIATASLERQSKKGEKKGKRHQEHLSPPPFPLTFRTLRYDSVKGVLPLGSRRRTEIKIRVHSWEFLPRQTGLRTTRDWRVGGLTIALWVEWESPIQSIYALVHRGLAMT